MAGYDSHIIYSSVSSACTGQCRREDCDERRGIRSSTFVAGRSIGGRADTIVWPFADPPFG